MTLKKYKTTFLGMTLLVCSQGFSQSDTLKVKFVASTSQYVWTPEMVTFQITNSEYSFSHNPEKKDGDNVKKLGHLTLAEPNAKNFDSYYKLACSYWELERLEEAEKMFLKILNSTKDFYESSYRHSSDISGDKTANTYGYGSFTSNYKHDASFYLSLICIDRNQFEKALIYVDLAAKKYTITYTCGTGHDLHMRKINGLYGICYEGLGQYREIVDLFMPLYPSSDTPILGRAIKKIYNEEEIASNLKLAESELVFLADTFPSSTFTYENYGGKNEKEIEEKYFSGTATTMLFGFTVETPSSDFHNGDIAKREDFVVAMKNSSLFKDLKK